MGGLNRPDTPERLARNVTNNSSKKFICSSWRSYLAKMIFPPLDFSVSLTESAAWTSMNISAIPPCRSQPRWVCTNMQGLDYCNWVTGKPMPPPHLQHDSADKVLHYHGYTHQLEPNLVPAIQPGSHIPISCPQPERTHYSFLTPSCTACSVLPHHF